VSHGLAFFVAVPLAVAFALLPDTAAGRAAAIAYGAAVAFMFGASGAYHRLPWSPRWRPIARRIDHTGVYVMIAGSYTPAGLLVLSGNWRLAVLGAVWSAAALAVLIKVCWIDAPRWLAASLAIAIGWIGVLVLPQLWSSLGATACLLLVAGGLAYTLGGIVYATRRPDPRPDVFGFHEVFHVLVIVAVALQYTAIAIFVLPAH
jgi:hemolysin III